MNSYNHAWKKKTESLSKKIEVKKSQVEMLEMKRTVTEIKIAVDVLNSREQRSEERISELEDNNKIT